MIDKMYELVATLNKAPKKNNPSHVNVHVAEQQPEMFGDEPQRVFLANVDLPWVMGPPRTATKDEEPEFMIARLTAEVRTPHSVNLDDEKAFELVVGSAIGRDIFDFAARGAVSGGIHEKALVSVIEERGAQAAEWGDREHDDEHDGRDWCSFIAQQRDKAALCANKPGRSEADVIEFRSRMVKIAALAIAAIESYDRGGSCAS